MGLPTIENSWAILATKGIQGFDHAEYPAIGLALEILNASEGYLSASLYVKSLSRSLTRLYSDTSVDPESHMGLM